MSIYPVPLQKWFPHPRIGQYIYGNYSEAKNLYETVKFLVKFERCDSCGKHCKFNRAWGHHSLPFGYGEVWCTEKCLFGTEKRKKQPRLKKIRNKKYRFTLQDLKKVKIEAEKLFNSLNSKD